MVLGERGCSGGAALGEVQGGEALIGMYCMKEEKQQRHILQQTRLGEGRRPDLGKGPEERRQEGSQGFYLPRGGSLGDTTGSVPVSSCGHLSIE